MIQQDSPGICAHCGQSDGAHSFGTMKCPGLWDTTFLNAQWKLLHDPKLPVKYFQIMTPGINGVLRPFEVNQFGETESFFYSEAEAEKFIAKHFADAQQPGEVEKKELVLIIMPVFLCRFRPVG